MWEVSFFFLCALSPLLMAFEKAVCSKVWYWAEARSKTKALAVHWDLLPGAPTSIKTQASCLLSAAIYHPQSSRCSPVSSHLPSWLGKFHSSSWVCKSFCDKSSPSLFPLSVLKEKSPIWHVVICWVCFSLFLCCTVLSSRIFSDRAFCFLWSLCVLWAPGPPCRNAPGIWDRPSALHLCPVFPAFLSAWGRAVLLVFRKPEGVQWFIDLKDHKMIKKGPVLLPLLHQGRVGDG